MHSTDMSVTIPDYKLILNRPGYGRTAELSPELFLPQFETVTTEITATVLIQQYPL